MSDPGDALTPFAPYVAGWFRDALGTPTLPQVLGWPVIARGEHALIVAPTGSGKTLTAFLWSLDVLFSELAATPEPDRAAATGRRSRAPAGKRAPEEVYRAGVRVVYVSPLKALNNDVERNLAGPLAGIQDRARRSGETLPTLRVAVRTGDTPSAERQKMGRKPPHILITTPESLYLLLTAERARAMFATTHTVIVDEIHTLVGSKRGAHLAISLERLQHVSERPLQRIGLSATVRPLENAAGFLGGQDAATGFAPRPVTVVDAGRRKPLDLQVVSCTDDFRQLPGNSLWRAIIPEVTQLIDRHRTTLIFCNNRRLAERTADRLNERRLLEKELDKPPGELLDKPLGQNSGDLGIFAAGIDPARLAAAGLQPIRAHHGSMSKVARLEMEGALKAGTLPALVATSSLELGIDIGTVDLVVHLQSPKSVSSGLQRVGRSGHLVGQTSVGRIFATHAEDVVEAAAVAWGMLHGEIESTHTPENPLDILAQHIMAMVGAQDWAYRDIYDLVRAAYPYRHLTQATFRSVVEMLSGKYPESVSRNLQARLSWDRVNDRLVALPGSRLLAVQSGGTIPDRGTYALVLGDHKTKVGELDEEFVFESRPGDTFLLGSQVWRVSEITDDRVIAEPAPGEIPRMPFWRGDYPWRPYDLGKRVGAFRRTVVDMLTALAPEDNVRLCRLDEHTLVELPATTPAGRLLRFLHDECVLDRNSIGQLVGHLSRQLAAVGQIASDRTIVVEVFEDTVGDPRMVVHSPFGGRVNGPWAIALAHAIREQLRVEPQIISGDDGIMLRCTDTGHNANGNDLAGQSNEVDGTGTSGGQAQPPFERLPEVVATLTGAEAKERLLAELPNSPVFGAQFRMNAARALLLPRQRAGKRTPLWLSRLKAKDLLQAVQGLDDFPIVLETYRDCLCDVMDLDGLLEVLDQIQRGEIQVVVHESAFPSPLAASLDYRLSMQYVYENDAPRGEKQLAALSVDRTLLADLLQDGSLAELLKPEAVAAVTARVARTGAEAQARNAEELAQMLYEMGDLSDVEIAERIVVRDWADWVRQLAGAGRILRLEIGREMGRAVGDQEVDGTGRWINAELRGEYERLAENPLPVLRRWLLYAGPVTVAQLAARYGLLEAQVRQSLSLLGNDVVAGQFTRGTGEQWIDRHTLEQMHRRTLTLLRKEVQPVPIYAYAEFLRRWQGASVDVHGASPGGPRGGLIRQGVAARSLDQVLQQLRGLAVSGQAWERDVLPARLPNFDPTELAARCQAGEVLWAAEGGREARRARVRFFFRGEGGIFLDRTAGETALDALDRPARATYDYLREEGAALLPDIADTTGLDTSTVQAALVELVLAGLVTNDTLAALHAVLVYEPLGTGRGSVQSVLETQLTALLPERRFRPLARQRTQHRWREVKRRARAAVFVAGKATHAGQSGWTGRWSLVHRASFLGKPLAEAERVSRQTRQLLARWGVVTRACLEREAGSVRWDAVYPVLAQLEMRGEIRRGYFVEGLPGIQFALPDVVDQLRAVNGERLTGSAADAQPPVVLSAVDPAQLFGADSSGNSLRFSRVPASAVALHQGQPVAVMEDNGAVVRAVTGHPALVPALRSLARWWSPRMRGHLKVERWHGEAVLGTSGAAVLEAAGFVRHASVMLWPRSP